jgi:sorbitol-specific phosphotransferase system component IIC
VSRSFQSFITEPLEGKTSLSRVIWLYGVLGSLLYGAIELFLNPGNVLAMRLYAIGGLIFSIYVTLATYRCAGNCRSAALAKVVRVSAVITLLLLPVITYLDLTGTLTLSGLLGEQLPE